MLLERLFGERRSDTVLTSNLRDPAKWLIDLFAGASTSSGEPVTVASAEGLPAVYRCRQLLAWSVGMLPLKLVEVLESGDKREARDESLYHTLHDAPNPEMTPFDFWSNQMDQLTGWGNAYAFIERDSQNHVLNLWPLRPEKMSVDREPVANRLRYRYELADGSTREWLFNWRTPAIWHLRINALDGIHGRSPIQLHRETIGRAIAVGKFGGKFFSNGATTTGALKVPGNLTQPQRDDLKKSLAKTIGGANQLSPLLLEGGMEWTPISIPNDQAQFIETMRYSRSDVAMIYGVPPHMIGETDKVTSWGSGIEQMGIGFVTYTLDPYLVAIEQAVPLYLLNTQTAKIFRAEFVREALLRADTKSRNEALQIERQNGVINADEWRRATNRNAIGGDAGQERWRPSNMGVAGEKPPAPVIQPPVADAGGGADDEADQGDDGEQGDA